MPCACQLPPEIYPDATEWGPLLWCLLHGIGEKVGSSIQQFRADERRCLLKLFDTLQKVIPCPSCKEHFTVYLHEHPVQKAIRELSFPDLRIYIRTWFWELHNWVNESLGRPLFLLEDVATTYDSVKFRKVLNTLDIPMQRAIRVRTGQLMAYKEFKNNFLLLLSLYGI